MINYLPIYKFYLHVFVSLDRFNTHALYVKSDRSSMLNYMYLKYVAYCNRSVPLHFLLNLQILFETCQRNGSCSHRPLMLAEKKRPYD